MAYGTGPGSSPTDLLQRLVTWLNSQGWNTDMSQADGSGWRAHLHKPGTGVYVNLRAAHNEIIQTDADPAAKTGIAIYLGTGFSSGSAWHAQAGRPLANGQTYTEISFCRLPIGAVIGWKAFQDGNDNIIVVIEKTGGIFAHLGFGVSLNKVGSWTGGPYFFASSPMWNAMTDGYAGDAGHTATCPMGCISLQNAPNVGIAGASGFVRVDVDGFTGNWVGVSCIATDWRLGYTGKNGVAGIRYRSGEDDQEATAIPGYQVLWNCLVSTMTTRAVLLPVRIYVQRDGGGWSMIGTLPSIYVSSAVGQGYNALSTYTVGAKTFMLFPSFAVLQVV